MAADLKQMESKMNKTLEVLDAEFATVRAGRANPRVLDQIRVDYYGAPTPLQGVANISVPEARVIVIQPWDKTMRKAIIKAIQTSELGINPSDDGSVIRLVFPEMTEDRRKELSKDVRKKAEAAKVAIRNIRREAVDADKKAQKASEISEDEMKTKADKIQKTTDKFIERIDKETEVKIAEIMTV